MENENIYNIPMEHGSIELKEDDEEAKGNKIRARIKIIYEFWLYIRAKVEEIMEPVLFFGGGILTALIALGILPWGALGIGICATLTFIGISRFVLTNSWTWWHNRWATDKKENENKGENTENDNEQEEQEEENDILKEYEEDVNKEEEKQGTGFVKANTTFGVVSFFKLMFIPIILAITGITFGILGATGVLGLGLALGIGIPSLILVAMALVLLDLDKRNTLYTQLVNIKASDSFWGVSMLVAGLLSVATFAVLGLTGVLALPTAIALGAPGLALAGIMALIFVGTFIRYWIKNYKEKSRIRLCSFIGLSWNPDFVLSKPEGARLSRPYFDSKTGEYEKHIILDKF